MYWLAFYATIFRPNGVLIAISAFSCVAAKIKFTGHNTVK